MRTQKLVAEYLAANGWPFAESTGAARQGSDVTGTPDIAVEVKARTALEPLAWIRQAVKAADGRVPFVVFRCNGQGEEVGDYPALIRTRDLVALLRQAGYGDSEPPEGALGSIVGVGPDADHVARLAEVLDQMNAKAVRRALRRAAPAFRDDTASRDGEWAIGEGGALYQTSPPRMGDL